MSFVCLFFILLWSEYFIQAIPTDPTCPLNASSDVYNVGLYYVNWAIYVRNFQPSQLPYQYLTHVFYAFAKVEQDGTVALTDTWADLQKHFKTDSWNDSGNNVYGCIKQLFLLKKKNRNLKTLLSIGGWTLSGGITSMISDPVKRANFARTATALVTNLGFDGIDIDWEYPDKDQGQAFTSLLQECRSVLDQVAGGYHFYLSVAVTANPEHYSVLDVAGMDQVVDLWNFMGYDYTGSFSNLTGHSSNLFPSSTDPTSTPFNTLEAISYYLAKGATAQKILLGMPMYGHEFSNTTGMGKPYFGAGPGSYQTGIYDYKALPLAGAIVYSDSQVVASWSVDLTQQEVVSFDTTGVAQMKAAWVQKMGLGGGMWWESSGDREIGNGSLVEAFVDTLGGLAATRQEENCLDYPLSEYNNLRAQFD